MEEERLEWQDKIEQAHVCVFHQGSYKEGCGLEFSKNKDIQALQLISLRWHSGRV